MSRRINKFLRQQYFAKSLKSVYKEYKKDCENKRRMNERVICGQLIKGIIDSDEVFIQDKPTIHNFYQILWYSVT